MIKLWISLFKICKVYKYLINSIYCCETIGCIFNNYIWYFSSNYSPEIKLILTEELSSCLQLHDLEPENKCKHLLHLVIIITMSVQSFGTLLTIIRKNFFQDVPEIHFLNFQNKNCCFNITSIAELHILPYPSD